MMASKPHTNIGLGRELFKKVHRRRGTTKAKTGCFCCKKRRVKCDETRPRCLRCIRFGICCDGYPSPPPKIVHPKLIATSLTVVKAERKVTYPEILATHYAPAMFLGHITRHKLLVTPSSALKFADETEERFFRTFQTEIAAELAGPFSCSFWDCLLLQTCLEEPFTQKIVIALAAMITSRKLSRQIESNPAYRSIATQQAQFAYTQYQKALKEMRTSLTKVGDTRKAVVGCLLVCVFESLVGNFASAHANAISGQKLLEQFVAQHPYKQPHQVGIVSPANHLIEDDIIQTVTFFDIQVTAYLDPRPPHVHNRLRHEGDETIAQMPEKFQTLREAHRYGILMFRRISHSCREIGELAGDGRLSTTSAYQILEEGTSALSLVPGGDPRLRTPIKDTDIFVAQQQQYSRENQRWRLAFGDLFERIQLSANVRDRVAARALLALSRAFDLTIFLSLDIDNCSCDHLSFEFNEIISLLREPILYKMAQDPNSEFTTDLAVNSTLFMPARFCRERATRREAIALMRMYRMREGYFDGEYAAAMCERVMELEEEGVETDFIPGCARIRFLEETVHPEQRWSTFRYVRGSEETVREALFRW